MMMMSLSVQHKKEGNNIIRGKLVFLINFICTGVYVNGDAAPAGGAGVAPRVCFWVMGNKKLVNACIVHVMC